MAVPDAHLRAELIEQLRKANAHFHQSREAWEKSLAESEFSHAEHVDAARQKLQDAEREVEEIEERIKQTFPLAPDAGRREDSGS